MTSAEAGKAAANIAVINVLSGIHAGAIYPCSNGVYSIGASFDDDVVLTDPSVCPSHLKLSITNDLVGLSDAVGPTKLGARSMSKVDSIMRRYPVELWVGDAQLRITAANAGLVTPNRLIALGLAVALFAGVALLHSRSAASFHQQRFAQNEAHLNTDGYATRGQDVASASAQSELVKQSANQFGAYLVERDLASVTLSSGSAAINAKGAIPVSDQAKWREAQIWFDTNFGQRVQLISEVLVTAKKEEITPIRVQAIWAGPNPYVIDASGNKYFEGSTLQSGWSIEKIEQSRITLHRNNDRLVLRL